MSSSCRLQKGDVEEDGAVAQGGILSIDVALDNENLIATAGADSVIVLFDREASRIRASLNGHSKKINSALFLLGCP